MQTYKYKKRPDEIVTAEWSFDPRMTTTETVVSRSATASGLTIANVGADADGRGVSCKVSDGADGADVVITFGIVTSLGQELFDDVTLRIRADP